MFFAKLLFTISVEEGNHTPQFEEQLRYIEADNEHLALGKAIELGNALNEKNEFTSTTFVAVTQIIGHNELKNGTEICSRIFENESKDNYIAFAHHLQEDLLANSVMTHSNNDY